jgi:hypothetical protein
MSTVKTIVRSPDAMDTMRRNLEDEALHLSSANAEITCSDEETKAWAELCNKYPCSICVDVLAAPVVLDCGHSFCGVCISDYFNCCASADVEVVHECPCCHAESSCAARYERAFDNVVQDDVEKVPYCADKEEWQARHRKYMIMLTEANTERTDAQEKPKWWLKLVYAVSIVVIALIVVVRR